jgi:hypothetical protein
VICLGRDFWNTKVFQTKYWHSNIVRTYLWRNDRQHLTCVHTGVDKLRQGKEWRRVCTCRRLWQCGGCPVSWPGSTGGTAAGAPCPPGTSPWCSWTCSQRFAALSRTPPCCIHAGTWPIVLISDLKGRYQSMFVLWAFLIERHPLFPWCSIFCAILAVS